MALIFGIVVWVGIAAGIAILVRTRHHGVAMVMLSLGLWLCIGVALLIVGVHTMGLTPQSRAPMLHTP